MHTLTLKYLSQKNNVSTVTLSTRFQKFLAQLPTALEYLKRLSQNNKIKNQCSGFLLIDGDWFGRKRVLIVYKDSQAGILFWRFADGEYKAQVKQDIEYLKDKGYPLKGTVSDGKNSLVNAAKSHQVPVQRCLVHIQMRLKSLLTQNPQSAAGKQLKEWSYSVNKISNQYEAKILLLWFIRLYKRHKDFIKEKTNYIDPKTDKKRWWYTHKNVRKAYRLIANSFGQMFTYLRFKNMPKDTNGLEGFFSQLDTKISRHRGLKQPKKENLIAWLLYLKRFPKTTQKEVKNPHLT
ncbi:MAG: hypothetical protein U9O78_01270 [Patescibacteria group bacterium]|nr:hypothetical protein [Patescibacteria group bacterium]